MHADTEELLSLLDGPVDASIEAHVRECASCRDELDALERQRERLRALPLEVPPAPGPALFDAAARQALACFRKGNK
ncbi:MAG: hypothetical protein AAFU65_18580, partial [Pseudomonadota bacterium]